MAERVNESFGMHSNKLWGLNMREKEFNDYPVCRFIKHDQGQSSGANNSYISYRLHN